LYTEFAIRRWFAESKLLMILLVRYGLTEVVSDLTTVSYISEEDYYVI